MGSVTIEHMRDLQKKVNLCTHTLLLYFFFILKDIVTIIIYLDLMVI